MKNETVIFVELKYIKEPVQPVRTQLDEEKFAELCESIKKHGIIEPIICIDKETHLEIIAGHRRFMASTFLKLDKVPVIIKNYSEEDKLNIKINENYGREDVSAVDEAVFFYDIISNKKMSIDELAKNIGKNKQYVERRLSIMNLQPDILEAIKNDGISLSVGFILSKIDNDNERVKAIEYSVNNGCSARTAQLWLQQWELTKSSIDFQSQHSTDTEQGLPEGKILWPCALCGQLGNAQEMYNMPFHKECRENLIRNIVPKLKELKIKEIIE